MHCHMQHPAASHAWRLCPHTHARTCAHRHARMLACATLATTIKPGGTRTHRHACMQHPATTTITTPMALTVVVGHPVGSVLLLLCLPKLHRSRARAGGRKAGHAVRRVDAALASVSRGGGVPGGGGGEAAGGGRGGRGGSVPLALQPEVVGGQGGGVSQANTECMRMRALPGSRAAGGQHSTLHARRAGPAGPWLTLCRSCS